MEEIEESLSNLEENLEWGQILFENRFEAVGSHKSSPSGDNVTEVVSQSVSKEKRKHIGQYINPLEQEEAPSNETILLVKPDTEPTQKLWRLELGDLVILRKMELFPINILLKYSLSSKYKAFPITEENYDSIHGERSG